MKLHFKKNRDILQLVPNESWTTEKENYLRKLLQHIEQLERETVANLLPLEGPLRKERMDAPLIRVANSLAWFEAKYPEGYRQSVAGYILMLRHTLDEIEAEWMKQNKSNDTWSTLNKVSELTALGLRILADYRPGSSPGAQWEKLPPEEGK